MRIIVQENKYKYSTRAQKAFYAMTEFLRPKNRWLKKQ